MLYGILFLVNLERKHLLGNKCLFHQYIYNACAYRQVNFQKVVTERTYILYLC